MKLFSFKAFLLFVSLYFFSNTSFSQSVYPLVANITVDSVLPVHFNPTKIALDPVSGNLFYSTLSGDIYEIFNPNSANPSDTLRFTASNHHITSLQGFTIKDSAFFLSGNVNGTTTGIGLVMRATLKPNGTRVWDTLAYTQIFPTSGTDHGFSEIVIDSSGKFVLAGNGGRTHFGEVKDNGGAYPGKREIPLSAKIFKLPIDTTGIFLPNDSVLLNNSGFVFATGTRNTYKMAWDGNKNLFGIDNSGDRDDPEELNWLRQGKNYGFPWRMGSDYNPMINTPYNPSTDLLVNQNNSAYTSGWFSNDPAFPQIPIGTAFYDPIRNYGPDADFFRDSITGKVKNASDLGTFITSFSSHRSPLGLVFDRDSLFAAPYRGDAFMLSFMPGGDSTGFTTLSPWGGPCAFVDPVRDLLHLKLTYNSATDNFDMTATKIVFGFYLPVDAVIAGNSLFVLENGAGGDLWKITLPLYSGINEVVTNDAILVYPNPTANDVAIKFYNKENNTIKLWLTDVQGKNLGILYDQVTAPGTQQLTVNMNNFAAGIYFYNLKIGDHTVVGKIVKGE